MIKVNKLDDRQQGWRLNKKMQLEYNKKLLLEYMNQNSTKHKQLLPRKTLSKLILFSSNKLS